MRGHNIKLLSTLTLAFVSMMYEFVNAQTIASYVGSTFYIYCLTIGAFTFSLGFGSIFFEKIKRKLKTDSFYYCEVLLSVFGSLSPILVVALYHGTPPHMNLFFKTIIMLIPAMLCGFLSGFELPFLMQDLERKKISFKVLCFDYAGMFLATLLFPAVIITKFNLIQVALSLGIANLIILLIYPKDPPLSPRKLCAVALLIGCILIGLYNHYIILDFISSKGF